MNHRIYLFLSCLFLAHSLVGQNAIDTTYYDRNGKGCDPAFASYYRVYTIPSDSTHTNRLRDYYITGELKAESEFITIDLEDDAKTILDGEFITYFKNGKIEEKGCRIKNKKVGEYTQYREDGLVVVRTSFLNGKVHGLYTEFTDDDDCIQREYSYGKPIYDYYYLSNKDGFCSKIDAKTHEPIYDSPSLEELKREQNEGKDWYFYNINNLFISLNNTKIRDYGKYFQITLQISNDSMFPVEFDPREMTASLVDKKGRTKDLRVYTFEEYQQKVRSRQNLAIALTALGEGIAVGCSDYSTVSVTNTYHPGSGFAFSTTTSFDAASAFQAEVLAAGTIIGLTHAMHADRKVKKEGYLKKTIIYPGETISGHVNIERKKGERLTVVLQMNGARYEYPWEIK